jgi:hypothetical protein
MTDAGLPSPSAPVAAFDAVAALLAIVGDPKRAAQSLTQLRRAQTELEDERKRHSVDVETAREQIGRQRAEFEADVAARRTELDRREASYQKLEVEQRNRERVFADRLAQADAMRTRWRQYWAIRMSAEFGPASAMMSAPDFFRDLDDDPADAHFPRAVAERSFEAGAGAVETTALDVNDAPFPAGVSLTRSRSMRREV